jgi:tetratricopeptide (TPR) repeat protein
MLRQRPNSYQLLYGYATILENKGRYDEAIKVFNKLIEVKPEFPKSYLGLAYIYELHRI